MGDLATGASNEAATVIAEDAAYSASAAAPQALSETTSTATRLATSNGDLLQGILIGAGIVILGVLVYWLLRKTIKR